MTTTLSYTSTNPHIESLETVFADSQSPVEFLVIAHNDSQMVQSLSKAMNNASIAVLEVSQDTWDFDGQQLTEAIEWALQQDDLKNVYLVGYFQPSQTSIVDQDSQPQSSFDKLLAGVRQSTNQIQTAQAQFASHVQKLAQIPVVHNRCANDELAVHGLAYRADGGVFLAYDAENDTFHTIG